MMRSTLLLGAAIASIVPVLVQGSEPGSRWTGFRGNGDSITTASKLPLEWAHDQNIAWRVDVPGMGQSTPVVFDGRIFLTSVEGPKKELLNLFAIDLASGKVVWHKQMKSSRPHPTGDRVSRAAPTPAVEGGRVYALFDAGDLFAFSRDGEQLWHVDFNQRYGVIQGGHDFGSSLRLHGERLYAHVSQAKPSYLVAIRKADGSGVWHNEMPMEGGYGTPVVTRHEGKDLLLASSQGGMIAYDAETGNELWKQVREGARGGGIPSLSVANGIAVVASADKGKSFAVRLADPSKIAWTAEAASTQYSSPLLHGGRAYLVNAVGVLFAVDLETGKQIWNTRLPGPVWASAIGAGDHLYFFTTEGSTAVFRSGDKPDRVADNTLPVASTVYAATPIERSFLVRTGTELWKLADVGKVKSYGTPETLVSERTSDSGPAPKPLADAKPGTVWMNSRDGLEYVLIPGGKFTMGCATGACLPDESPAQEVEVAKPLWMGRTEVTVAAYRKFATATGARLPEEARLLDRPLNPRWHNAKLPIVNMTASQAEAYCNWIGGRLPSEKEWEYAAQQNGDSVAADAIWSAENSGSQPLTGAVLQQRRGIEEKLYGNGNALKEVATRKPN
ncbi:MAG: PQQ-binding-like beta-propeller repeat protein, partial [Bryobacterales bacterium]|nr:PQQ-binding-like beta-propeller repeat protein [Bryobacterales bacterium]